jgi:hypothetical protein
VPGRRRTSWKRCAVTSCARRWPWRGDGEHRRPDALPLLTAMARRLHGARVGAAGAVGAARRPRVATAAPVARVSRGPRPAGPLASGPRADAVPGRRAAGGAGLALLALGAAPTPGVCARGLGLSALRRPAADPRGGDGVPRRAPAPRGARAGAPAACLGRLTRRRARLPRAAARPVCSAPVRRSRRRPLCRLRTPCRPRWRRAIVPLPRPRGPARGADGGRGPATGSEKRGEEFLA